MKRVIRIVALVAVACLVFGMVSCSYSGSDEDRNTEVLKTTDAVTEMFTEDDNLDESEIITKTESVTESEIIVESESVIETEGVTASEGLTEIFTETEDIFELTVEEKGEVAEAVSKRGLRYFAKNYISANSLDGFKINQGFEVTFPEGTFNREYNRFTLDYSATAPMKVFVTYTVDGKDRTDYYYVEGIMNSLFRGIIDTYLDGKNSTALKKIVFSTCEENDAYLYLYNVTLDTLDFYPDDVFVENDRFKIGARLSWGGAMTYFEDKKDGIADLGNLVNIHDTGRLIQQSFYGTFTNEEYTSGYYSNRKWQYNPVQAGNIYQTGRTRLIDLEIGEDSIYVKTQSLDWAHDNKLTHCYYENTYTVCDSYVSVDNRMVDFSGWEHIMGAQELPAVYVVSYLGTFVYYNGVKPWTDDRDGIHYANNMGSWGSTLTIPLVEENSETWAVWLNNEGDFGLGVYVPNVDRLVAMRHQYNGSKDPMSNSCSYVTTSSLLAMESYLPVEYQYLIATGSLEDIRTEFKENKDFAQNESLDVNKTQFRVSKDRLNMTDLDFSIKGTERVFSGSRILTVDYDEGEGAVRLSLTDESDPFTYLDFYWNSDKELYAEDYNAFELTYMIPVTNSKKSYNTTLFLCAGDVTAPNGSYTVGGGVIADGEYHTLSIRLPKEKWSGLINQIRLDIVDSGNVGDIIFVKSIRLVNYPDLGAENDMSIENCDQLISAANRTLAEFDQDERALKLKVLTPNDVGILLDFSKAGLLAENYTLIEVIYMAPTTNTKKAYTAEFFLCAGDDSGFAGDRRVLGDIVADGQYHTLSLPLMGVNGWSGELKKIRFDYFRDCGAEDVIYIKSIVLK